MFYRRDVRALRQFLHQIGPDLVHAHGTGVYAAAALSDDFPVSVITPHGIVAREAELVSGLRERIPWYLQARWEFLVLKRARHLIAISTYVERELAPRSKACFHLIENPVDDGWFSLGDPPRNHRILWVGRMIPRKDPQTAIRAFSDVQRSFPQARLRMVGEVSSDSVYARATQKLVAQLGLGDSVQFLDQLDRKALISEYEAAQLVLMTSLQETAPVVIAEALAGGRPVVATDVGGCSSLIRPGRTGLLAPKGDDVTLAQRVRTLLASPDLTLQMSGTARRDAQARFRAAAAVDRTLALYENLLSLRQSSGQPPKSAQAMKL